LDIAWELNNKQTKLTNNKTKQTKNNNNNHSNNKEQQTTKTQPGISGKWSTSTANISGKK
jgi:hypothetical protein